VHGCMRRENHCTNRRGPENLPQKKRGERIGGALGRKKGNCKWGLNKKKTDLDERGKTGEGIH